LCTDLEAAAAIFACVTRAAAFAGAYTATVTYQYDDVAGQIKRDIQAENQDASDMRAEVTSEVSFSPTFCYLFELR